MSKTPAPFGDASFEIEGLTVESAEDRVSLHGSLDLTRDQAGLAKARKLRDYLGALVEALESDPHLPKVTPVDAPVLKANPLA